MFENYNNIPTTYYPNNTETPKFDNRIHEKPLGEYDKFGRLVGYSWSYGDAVVLSFNVVGYAKDERTGAYMLPDEYFKGQNLDFTIYDCRNNAILTIVPNSMEADRSHGLVNIIFYIDSDDSARLLPRGNYTCELKGFGRDGIQTTLFSREDGRLFVK